MQHLTTGYLLSDIVFALAVWGLWNLTHRVIYKSFKVMPTTLLRPFYRQLWVGAAWGSGMLLVSVLLIWIAGGFSVGSSFTPFNYADQAENGSFLFITVFFLLQSLWEELVFRGIGLVLLIVLFYWLGSMVLMPENKLASEDLKLKVWYYGATLANAIVSVAFALVHSNNQNINIIGLVNIALAGVVMGQLFINQGTILGAWLAHTCWNLTQALLGLPVSGIQISPSVIGVGFIGARDTVISGGQFGPEASIFASLVLMISWIIITRQGLAGMNKALSTDTGPVEEPAGESE